MWRVPLIAFCIVLVSLAHTETVATKCNKWQVFLQGKWDLYGTDLQDNHIWTGYIEMDRCGNVLGGEWNASLPGLPGDKYAINEGNFELNIRTGKVTGTFVDSEGVITRVDATMNRSRKQITGVMKAISGDEEEGIFVLVKWK